VGEHKVDYEKRLEEAAKPVKPDWEKRLEKYGIVQPPEPEYAKRLREYGINPEEALICKLCGKRLSRSVKEFMEHLEREHWAEFVDKVEETFFTLVPKSSSPSSSPKVEGRPSKMKFSDEAKRILERLDLVEEGKGVEHRAETMMRAASRCDVQDTIREAMYLGQMGMFLHEKLMLRAREEELTWEELKRLMDETHQIEKETIGEATDHLVKCFRRGSSPKSSSPEVEEAEYERIREVAMRVPPARQKRFV